VIQSFGDKLTEDLYHGESSSKTRKFPPDLKSLALRKLDMVNAAHTVQDLKVPPGNRLELLKGDLAGFFSIRINDQFRIVFKFKDGQATQVRIADYH
jgi:proteic killer suppression protein